MRKKQKACVAQPVYKKPNLFLYCVLWIASQYAKLHYKVTYNKNQLKEIRTVKSPVLVIASHHGPLDFAFVARAMMPRRLSFVTAANIYYISGLGGLFRMTKSNIPKKQFTTDYSSVKSIRKMLDAGVSVVMYPEARYSLDGRNGRISDATYKLIKWLKVPVVTIKCNMVYQTRPRYINDFRTGRVFVEAAVALTPQDCQELPLDQIKQRIQPWLTFNDLEYQEQHKQHFKGKKGYAEGLPDLLYKCPKCGSEFANIAKGDVMSCKVCGNAVEIDGYNVIKPVRKDCAYFRRIDLWYDYQYGELKKEILSNPDYTLSFKVRLARNDDKHCTFVDVEEGVITLCSSGIIYNGEQYKEVRFRIPDPPAMSIDLIDHIDMFADNDDIFRFFFDGGEKPIKLNIALEILSDWCKTAKAKNT